VITTGFNYPQLMFKNVHQKLARGELLKAMQGRSPGPVQTALDKCERLKVNKHDDEVAAGRSRLAYLSLRKGTACVA